MASWSVYLVVTGIVAPALWTGLAIGLPAALALAWTASEWKRTVRQRQQMLFEVAFIQSMTDNAFMADVLEDRGEFWHNSMLASTAASSGLSSDLDHHVRDSLASDLADFLGHAVHRIHASQDRIGLLLDGLAGVGLLFTFRTATDMGSLAVALSAAFWLGGIILLDVHIRRRHVHRNQYLTRMVDEGAHWLAKRIQMAIAGATDAPKAFRRTELYRRLPWVRPA